MQTCTTTSDLSLTGPPEEVLFGRSAAMQELRARCELIAHADVPLLIHGESGTGKEVLARYLHARSPQRGPFLRVNCAAIPGPLLETELFGYERGAFTGATEPRPGKVELAAGGTLFLDEIGEMPLALQSKLLHLLQDGRFCRIGGLETMQARVRVMCATHCNLEEAVEARRFRQDLYYRIDVLALELPPLRERLEDIETLAAYHLERLSRRLDRAPRPLSREVIARLTAWHWPGNVRELENWIARYLVLGRDDVGPLRDQAPQLGPEPVVTRTKTIELKTQAREAVIAAERDIILRCLETHHWNKRKVARDLQISYRGLLYKIRAAGIGRQEKENSEP